jgi:hypothetical protein
MKELAQIARPAMSAQPIADPAFELGSRQTQAPRGTGACALDPVGEILLAIAQRGNLQREDSQTVEEVGPKAPLGQRTREVAMGGRDDPGPQAARARLAESLPGPFFEDPQELLLTRERQLTDLVEKEGARGRRLEATRTSRVGARIGTPRDAVELGLEQRAGEPRTIDVDQGAIPARARRVDRTREHTLSRPRLARDQDRRRQGGRARGRREQPPHRGRAAGTGGLEVEGLEHRGRLTSTARPKSRAFLKSRVRRKDAGAMEEGRAGDEAAPAPHSSKRMTLRITSPSCIRSKAWLMSAKGIVRETISSSFTRPFM